MFNLKTLFVAAAAVFIVAAPLAADAHDHRDRHDHRDHYRGWERPYGPPPGHWRHDHYRRYVPPPPVVYVPRPVYPPPVAYAPPPASFSIVVPFNLR